MTDYTPTTEQVREAFSEMSGWDMSAEEADAAFDRWLAEVRAGVVAEEPEWEQRYEHLKKFAAVAMVTLNGDPYGYRSPSNREAAELLASGLGVPVKQEGADDA